MKNIKEDLNNTKSFLTDLLKMQSYLQKHIKQKRERDVYDIRLSYIAELIEFLEETEYTYKTWKDKKVNNDAKLEEFVDILFFILEELEREENKDVKLLTKQINDIYLINKKTKRGFKRSINDLIISSMLTPSTKILKYFQFANDIGYNLDDIIDKYKEKWKKNINRIGKEWN